MPGLLPKPKIEWFNENIPPTRLVSAEVPRRRRLAPPPGGSQNGRSPCALPDGQSGLSGLRPVPGVSVQWTLEERRSDEARGVRSKDTKMFPNSVLAPGSDALVSNSFLLLLVRHLLLEAMHLLLVAFLLLVVRPGAPSSVVAPTPKKDICFRAKSES